MQKLERYSFHQISMPVAHDGQMEGAILRCSHSLIHGVLAYKLTMPSGVTAAETGPAAELKVYGDAHS